MPTSSEIRELLFEVIRVATRQEQESVVVNAADLHRTLGGYPNGGNHRIAAVCGVMRKAMHPGDVIVSEPPKGKGATLTIRYQTNRLVEAEVSNEI